MESWSGVKRNICESFCLQGDSDVDIDVGVTSR